MSAFDWIVIGFISRSRGSSRSNLLGAAASIVVVFLIKYNTGVGWPWFIVIGTLLTVAIGLLGRTAADVAARFQEITDAHVREENESNG